MSYKQIGWKDFPDSTTPVNASNLNHMDSQIKINDTNIGDMARISDRGSSVTEVMEMYCETTDKLNNDEATLLYSGKLSSSGEIVLLNDNIDNYKYLVFETEDVIGEFHITDIVPVSILKKHPHTFHVYQGDDRTNIVFEYISSTSLRVKFVGYNFFKNIYGMH